MKFRQCWHRSITTCAFVIGCTANAGLAQTATKTITGNGGTGFSGVIAGDITATVKAQTDDGATQTNGLLNITDIDFEVFSDSILIADQRQQNYTAVAPINIAQTSISINIPSTSFTSPVTSSLNVTAGDNSTGSVPGSDGAWDDPGNTGILNGATVNSFSATLTNDITAAATATGGFSASLQNDIRIPEVVDETFLDIDLRIKNSSSVSIQFSETQNISLKNLTLSSSVPLPLDIPLNNFVEASHPSGVPQLDLSAASGFRLVETQISGIVSADLTGTVYGNIDIAADLELFGVTIPDIIVRDDAILGALSDADINLISLNEAIALSNVEMPFLFSVLHEPTADLSFDDVTGLLQTTTFGIEFPVSISEEFVLTLPNLGFEIGQNGPSDNFDYRFDFDVLGANVTLELEHLQGEFSGQIVMDLQADLTLSADMLAEAFQANAINITSSSVPEPSGAMLLCLSATCLIGIRTVILDVSDRLVTLGISGPNTFQSRTKLIQNHTECDKEKQDHRQHQRDVCWPSVAIGFANPITSIVHQEQRCGQNRQE